MALINSGPGNNTRRGTPDGDEFRLGAGDDIAFGRGGEDWYYAEAGNDTFNGGEGLDRIDYRDALGAVRVNLAAGRAQDGMGGVDKLIAVERAIGSNFADVLLGTNQGNSFTGEGGADRINGRGGFDFVWYGRANSGVTVDLKAGTASGGEGSDILLSIEGLGGSNFDDVLLGNSRGNFFTLDHPDDEFTPNFGIGGGGTDIVDGRGGLDTVAFDRELAGVRVDLALEQARDGGGHIDTLRSIEGVIGSDFRDVLAGSAANERLTGGAGQDRLLGRGGRDVLKGEGGKDSLNGGGGNDVLKGGVGRDQLAGGLGRDQLTGGLGNDAFVFTRLDDAGDRISDFGSIPGNDDQFRIDASSFGGRLVEGTLAGSRFQSRTDNLAQDAGDRFIFRTTDATLWFDSNGSATGGLTLLADLQDGALVTSSDIFLI